MTKRKTKAKAKPKPPPALLETQANLKAYIASSQERLDRLRQLAVRDIDEEQECRDDIKAYKANLAEVEEKLAKYA